MEKLDEKRLEELNETVYNCGKFKRKRFGNAIAKAGAGVAGTVCAGFTAAAAFQGARSNARNEKIAGCVLGAITLMLIDYSSDKLSDSADDFMWWNTWRKTEKLGKGLQTINHYADELLSENNEEKTEE